MNTNKIKLLTLSIFLAFGLSACEKPASTESYGSKIDGSSDKTNEKSTDITRDTTLTTKVKNDILAEAALKGFDIGVKATDGEVTLTGTVDTQQNSNKAKKIASDVAGVKSVDNQIVVKP